jgi:acyl carrier protein
MFAKGLQGIFKATLSSQFIAYRGFSTNLPTIEYVESKVLETIKSFNKVKIEKLHNTAKFEEMGLDSLDIVELVCAIEDNMGFDITTEDAEKVLSVPTAVQIFHKYAIKSKQIKENSK